MTDVAQLLETRRSRFGRWAGAAFIICGLHVGGGALALMHWVEEEADDVAGALTVEMAPLPALVPVDTPDLAHGPVTEEATQTPEASEKVEDQVVEDIPPVPPSPAPEPEIALPMSHPEKKEEPGKQEEPKEAAPEKESPAEASERQIAMAPPRVEAQPAPASAPSQGQSATTARAHATWQKTVSNHLKRFKRYPEAAHRRGVQGVAVVRFTLDRSGHVITSEIVKSSGSSELDQEGLAMLKRASPLPVPPNEIPDAFLEVYTNIDFDIK
jgi:protein TonB